MNISSLFFSWSVFSECNEWLSGFVPWLVQGVSNHSAQNSCILLNVLPSSNSVSENLLWVQNAIDDGINFGSASQTTTQDTVFKSTNALVFGLSGVTEFEVSDDWVAESPTCSIAIKAAKKACLACSPIVDDFRCETGILAAAAANAEFVNNAHLTHWQVLF